MMTNKTKISTTMETGVSMELCLPLAHFRIQLRALTTIRFNHYSGSAWRGLFGHALKQVACVTHERDCRQCLLYRSCVYSYIFETPPPTDTRYMRRSTAAPHPFVLTPDFNLRTLPAGETTTLDLVLAGKAIDYLPYIVHALNQAGERGIGPTDAKFQITAIEQEQCLGSDDWQTIYTDGKLRALETQVTIAPPLPEQITLHFESPLRLRHQSKMMSPHNFAFSGLIANLLRRYSMISYFHGGEAMELDFKALVEQAHTIEHLKADLTWFNWRRYSSRQDKKIPMGGVIGEVEYRGEDIAPFWPLMWIGQWLHLGKGTSMGLGRYRIGSTTNEQNTHQAA